MGNIFSGLFKEIKADMNGPDGKVYYGWWNILACYPIIMFCFSAPLLMLQFIYVDIETELGFSRGDILTIATFKFGTAAIVAFFAGFMVDKWGAKKVIYICGTITAFGFSYWHFIGQVPYVDVKTSIWLAGIPLGFSSIPLLMATKTLTAKWFNKRLGLAIGILAAASSVSGILFTPLYAWLVETVGWRDALPCVSFAIIFIAFPIFHFMSKDNPSSEEIQSEFADADGNKQMVRGHLLEASKAGEEPKFMDFVKNPQFIIISIVLVMVGFVDQGFTKNSAFYIMNDLGFSKQEMAWSTVFSFVFGFSSKIFFGWLFDRWSFKGISTCYVLIAFSIVLAFGIQGVITLLIFQLARGFAHSGILLETPILAKHTFGPNHLGKIIGFFSAITAVGLAFGPRTVGQMHDAYGNYNLAFMICIVLLIICAIILYFLKPTYWLKLQEEKKANAESGQRQL